MATTMTSSPASKRRAPAASAADERVARHLCAAFVCLMASNYLLQPVRDAQVLFVGKELSSRLLTAATAFSLVVGPLVQFVARPSLLDTARAVQRLYRLFGLLCVCGVALQLDSAAAPRTRAHVSLVAAFYVCTQTVNNLAISVMFSFASDLLPTADAARYFAMFGAACTAGQGAGSLLASLLLQHGKVPAGTLLLFVAACLEAAARFSLRACRLRTAQSQPESDFEHSQVPADSAIATGPAANSTNSANSSANSANSSANSANSLKPGAQKLAAQKSAAQKKKQPPLLARLQTVAGDRLALMLALYTLCYTATMALIFLERSSIVQEEEFDSEAAASLSANISFAAATSTFAAQLALSHRSGSAAVARMQQWLLSPRVGLQVLPAVTALGYAALLSLDAPGAHSPDPDPGLTPGLAPGLPESGGPGPRGRSTEGAARLAVIVTFELARRVAAFAVTKPVRESLFGAVLPRERRFAVKSVLDTFVYRSGMAMGAMLFEALAPVADRRLLWAVHATLLCAWAAVAAGLHNAHKQRMRETASHNQQDNKGSLPNNKSD